MFFAETFINFLGLSSIWVKFSCEVICPPIIFRMTAISQSTRYWTFKKPGRGRRWGGFRAAMYRLSFFTTVSSAGPLLTVLIDYSGKSLLYDYRMHHTKKRTMIIEEMCKSSSPLNSHLYSVTVVEHVATRQIEWKERVLCTISSPICFVKRIKPCLRKTIKLWNCSYYIVCVVLRVWVWFIFRFYLSLSLSSNLSCLKFKLDLICTLWYCNVNFKP